MKITKKANSITASANDTQELNLMIVEDVKTSINSAISSLSSLAQRTGEPKYKEAIANLSVILLDLNA